MEVQDQEVEQELTPEQEAADDAAFEAAFNNARGDKPHAEGSTDKDADTEAAAGTKVSTEQDGKDKAAADAAADVEAQAAAQAKAQADAEAEANAPATVTRAELDALRAVAGQVTALQDELKRSNEKTFGHIGSLKQTLDAVKSQAQQGIKPTVFQLESLSKEFPEMAELFRGDLEKAFGAGNATQAEADKPGDQASQAEGDGKASDAQAQATEPPDPFADPRVQETLRAKEMAIVDILHPGWKALRATPEFNEWRKGLPAPAQQLLGSTWDSKVMNDAFTDFKTWQGKRAAAADASKQRGKRLENGIPPTSGAVTGQNAIDEDAAFLQGFKKASGR